MSAQSGPGNADDTREVSSQPEGSGRRDRNAPVKGGELRAGDIDYNQLAQQLPEKAKIELVKEWQKSQPEWVTAAKTRNRETIRLVITLVIFAAIVLEAAAAIYVAAIDKSSSWDHVKDWLTLSVAPLAAAAAVASTFWFPSREAE